MSVYFQGFKQDFRSLLEQQISNVFFGVDKPEIKTEDQLREFVTNWFQVKIPDKRVCPGHSSPWDAFRDAFFARWPVSVWKASRGFGGKTYLLALLGVTEALALSADVNILGGSGEQSKRLHRYMQSFVYHRSKERLYGESSATITRFVGGNEITALMASQRSVRGPHVPRLRLDEADEMDIKILDASLGQPMSKPGIPAQTVISSTHQNADGTFTEIMRRVKVEGWGYYEWCYKETLEPYGWLANEEIERKKKEVTKVMWQVEYEGQEPSPESRAILPEAINKMFDRNLGEFDGNVREYIEIEPPWVSCIKCNYGQALEEGVICPSCGSNMIPCSYATGADWAKEQDWTVIVTIRTDCYPMKLVAFERTGREPWPVMIGKLDKRMERYKRGRAAHDATGIGNVVDDYIKFATVGNVMVGKLRQNMLSRYVTTIENGGIIAPFIRFMEGEHRYCSVDDMYGVGHLPDTISAMANACTVLERGVYFG